MILTQEQADDLLRNARNVVYYIQNRMTNRVYIGQTERTFFDRYPGGKWWLYTTNRFLKADFKRFGVTAFDRGILVVVPLEENRLAIESSFICQFESLYPYGYNLSLDMTMHEDPAVATVYFSGIVGKRCGMSHPDEVISKAELSEHMAKNRSIEVIEKTKRALSKTHRGKIISVAHRKAVSRAHKGKKRSPETIARIRELATQRQGKAIVQCDLGGAPIAEFHSLNEAMRQTGIERRRIGAVLHGRSQRTGSFKWRFKS